MSDLSHREIVERLQSRWPESRVAPSLGRIKALCDLLGDPQKSAPVIQITGTNGKGSTAIMIDSLIRALGLRTGRFTSPHLQDVCERIVIDGEPISHQKFDELFTEVNPFVELVDAKQIDGVSMTFFEVITGMAYAAFADAPVDVMIMEVGMGGRWDATNVADAKVSVICPIGLDHTKYLGDTIEKIALEKAGIIKPGSTAVISAQQPEAAKVLLSECFNVGAAKLLEGPDFGLLQRQLAVDGQLIKLLGQEGPISDIYLPLHGAHMAENASVALAAVEGLLGRGLDPKVVVEGFDQVKAPARIEVVHNDPTVILDTCHNPQAARVSVDTISEALNLRPIIGVVSMMGDKNISATLKIFSELLDVIVVTKTSWTNRGMPVDQLAEIAAEYFPPNRIEQAESIPNALDKAMALADVAGEDSGVVILGSVIGAGEAREFLLG